MQDLPVDVSSLVELQCARRYQLRCVFGVQTTNDAAVYGSALHRYKELKTKGVDDPLIKAIQEYNVDNTSSLLMACSILDQRNMPPMITDAHGEPLVEWKFAIPYKEVSTDVRIVLCGTVDFIGVIDDNVIVLDYKTTRNRDTKVVLADLVMRLQLPWYIAVIKKFLSAEFTNDVREMIDNNRIFGQMRVVFLSHSPPQVIDSQVIVVSQDDEETIFRVLDDLIEKILSIRALGDELAYPEGMAYNLCAKCPFNIICSIRSKDRMLEVINSLPKAPYNPLDHR